MPKFFNQNRFLALERYPANSPLKTLEKASELEQKAEMDDARLFRKQVKEIISQANIPEPRFTTKEERNAGHCTVPNTSFITPGN